MTNTNDDPTDEPEDGVCVCCHAVADVRHCLIDTWRPEVCNECWDDGTYRKWLAEQIKAVALAGGWACYVDEHGNKLSDANPA